MAEQKGNIVTNNYISYVGGVAQIKTTNVHTSQPSEYEAFRSNKANELANFLHNPHVDFKNVIYAGCNTASRVYESRTDNSVMANGIGVARDKTTNLILYNGEWRLGYRHGYGVATLFGAQGTLIGEYKGIFRFNHRHGYGELTYPDGTVYKGEWKFDEKNGPGIEVEVTGGTFHGIWRNGRRVGAGRYIWPDTSSSFHFYSEDGYLRETKPIANNAAPFTVDKLINALKEQNHLDLVSKNIVGELTTAVPLGSEKSPAPGPLNLQMKMALKEFQEQTLPALNKRLQSVFAKLSVEVDVNSFSTNNPPSVAVWTLYVYKSGLVVTPIVEGLLRLADDKFYAEELGKEISKIVVRCVPKLHALALKKETGGVLTIEGSFDLGEESRINEEKFKELLIKNL
jgi:hypothetical protein